VVFGPIRESDQAGLAEAFVQVLVDTDRPVLRATDDVPRRFAERIAIGWDGKKAASQAVTAAMPLLQRAAHVETGMRSVLMQHVVRVDYLVIAAILDLIWLAIGGSAFLMFHQQARERGMLLQLGE
jgi:hypothetical protein